MRRLDLTNQVFGNLTALRMGARSNHRITWICRCLCGLETVVLAENLRSGHTTSCGCRKGRRGEWTAARFWALVRQGEPAECWPYVGRSKTPSGYGSIFWDGRRRGAHRLAWELFNSDSAGELEICHRCDNPICCNPHHLFIGTHYQNMMDAAVKGRMNRGANNGQAKLTADKVIQIRNSPESGTALADRFEVSARTIRDVRIRRSWQWLDEHNGEGN